MKRSLSLLLLTVALGLIPSESFAFGKNKIVYDNFRWQIYHSTHFNVYFYEEERGSLQKVVNFAESGYDDLSRKFNFQVKDKIPLIFYATHSAFEQTNVMLEFLPEGVGAFAEPVRNRMVLPVDVPDEKLLQLITHELTHIFEYEILFQGHLQKSLTSNPPTWFMEGLASFMSSDEDSRDRMVLRDAVVNDEIPSVQSDFGGYFAYRFGHAVFAFIQQKYGWEGLRDFVYEYRNTLGNSVEKPLKRTFDLAPDEFDTKFRTWLRKQYLPALVTKGEPAEYGDVFKVVRGRRTQELSPSPSPSGDLLAAITTYKEDVDVALFNIPARKLMRNLSPGYGNRYEYIIAQALTTGPVMGRDVAFSADGDHIAVFAKRERGRNLVIMNALNGNIERSVPMAVEQQLNPVYSPDGKKIAFHGFKGNEADIFIYDVDSGQITNLTNDAFFDASPVFSPDGKWLVYSSVVNGWAKLFRMDLSDPSKRYQLTTGAWNDIDAFFSPDGARVFYASDRQTGRNIQEQVNITEKNEELAKPESETPPPPPENFAAYNIYSLNLSSGEILLYTDVVGGCFTPVAFTGEGGKERIVFSSYYKREWQLYTMTTETPLRVADKVTLPSEPLLATARTPFQPPVEVAIDPEKIEKPGGLRMFVDNVDINAGVNSDQTFVSRSTIYMSDMLGNRRFIASLDSVSTFSNFDFLYLDMNKRLNWGARLFDNRTFFVTQDPQNGRLVRNQRLYRETGVLGLVSYPFNRYHRLDTGIGYEIRDIEFPQLAVRDGKIVRVYEPRNDNFPFVSSTFTGDSAVFKEFGPVSGRRYELSTAYSADTKGGGTLSNDYTVDFRQYLQISSRSLLAARVFGGYSTGEAPNFYYFGGLNTLRGYDFRSFVGNRAFFGNFEFRFPLVDVLATPVFAIQGIRGSIFFDVGGAWFNDEKFDFYKDRRLQDARAAVGYGVTMNVLGLELHWDFAKRTDLKQVDKNFQTSFWIGETF